VARRGNMEAALTERNSALPLAENVYFQLQFRDRRGRQWIFEA
jgi:hypothetical protein